jgi:hypothetical protein
MISLRPPRVPEVELFARRKRLGSPGALDLEETSR